MAKRTTLCRWCGRPVAQVTGPGRPKQFCRDSHKTMYHGTKRIAGGPIGLATLAERSDYMCGICSGPVDLLAVGSLGPSIDHVVPLTCGGEDHVRNLQLAHCRCNLSKRDRNGWTCPPVTGPDCLPPLTLF